MVEPRLPSRIKAYPWNVVEDDQQMHLRSLDGLNIKAAVEQ